MKINIKYVDHATKQHKDIGYKEFDSLADLLRYLNILNYKAAAYRVTHYISHADLDSILKEAK